MRLLLSLEMEDEKWSEIKNTGKRGEENEREGKRRINNCFRNICRQDNRGNNEKTLLRFAGL